MNAPLTRQRLWISALVLLGLALGLSLAVGRHAWKARHRLERVYHYTLQLAALQQQSAHDRGARAAFDQYPIKTPLDFETLLGDEAPPHARLRAIDPVRLPASGWTLRQIQVDFSQPNTCIKTALDWSAQIEQRSRDTAAAPQRPPWRLAQAVIHASPDTPGRGEVTLLFETLENPHE